MGHRLSGLIGSKDALESFSAQRALHGPVALAQGLFLLPLREEDLDSFMPAANTDHAEGFLCLSRQLQEELRAASRGATFAYVETQYFGGMGKQGAAVFRDGQIVFGPQLSERGPINESLRMLGATAAGAAADEFDAVGLHRHRHTEDWLELED